jgi:hypothetical protein
MMTKLSTGVVLQAFGADNRLLIDCLTVVLCMRCGPPMPRD